MDAIEIEFDGRDVLSFIAAYNGGSLVYGLSLRSLDGRRYADVELSVELSSAGTRLAKPWRRIVAAVSPIEVEWTRSDFTDFTLDVSTMLEITERRRAEFRITVMQGGVQLATASVPTEVLPADAWAVTSPFRGSVAELAGFVQPRDPALQPVLHRAAELLKKTTGTDGLDGYQSVPHSPERVSAIAEALYTAVQELGIGYINPPTSWDIHTDSGGQVIRLSGEVLRERLGTCLDTTILFASLLAASGLHPLVFLVPGHAFVGYWTREDVGRSGDVWPASEAHTGLDLGRIGVVETTMLTGSAPFASAVEAARARVAALAALSEQAGATAVVVDVRNARVRGIRQIPSKVIADDGSVTLIENREAVIVAADMSAALAGRTQTRAALSASSAPARIKSWQDSLLDLSFRNPLLNYRWPTASSASIVVPPGLLGSIEDLLQSGRRLKLHPNLLRAGGEPIALQGRRTLDASAGELLGRELAANNALFTDVAPDGFLTRMRRMATNARSVIDETGSNNLYLALGMVTWKPEKRATEVSSPLILVPVNLRSQNRSREFFLEVDPTSTVTPNFSLAEKLKQDLRIELPRLVEPELDDAGVDIDALLTYVREAFFAAGLHDFRVDESCTLGFFDFSTYRMWRDLQDSWPTFVTSPLVSHLVHTPLEPFVDPAAEASDNPVALDDFAAALPVLADGSQALAVRRAMAGETFVLQGPPGTGKSQTITNMLARALHSGKRVLFVAEKAGALGVVRDRLESVGLGAFGLNLHDKGMRPADVRRQLTEALDAAARADRTGYGAAQQDIDRSLAPLQRYPQRLHHVGALDQSVYSARSNLLAREGTTVALPVARAFLAATTPAEITALQRDLRDVADVGAAAGVVHSNPWSLTRADQTVFEETWRDALLSAVAAVDSAVTRLGSSAAGVAWFEQVESADELIRVRHMANRMPHPLSVVDAASVQSDARAQVARELESFGGGRAFAGATPVTLSAPVAELRAAAATARGSFFIGRGKRLNLVCRRVEEYLAPGSTVTAESLDRALSDIDQLQAAANAFVVRAYSLPGVVVAQDFNPLVAEHRAALAAQLGWIDHDVTLLTGSSAPILRLRDLSARATAQDMTLIAELASSFADVSEMLAADAEALRLWSARDGFAATLLRAAGRWYADANDRGLLELRRWIELWRLLSPVKARGLGSAVDMLVTGEVSYADAERAFELGFFQSALRQQLDDENLDAFDGRQHDSAARLFGAAADRLRELSPGILADDMIRSRGFDAGVSVGAVGELRRELGKTRGFKQIRRLLKDHWHVISRVTPCVLAVPDALVRFLDPELEQFDLVIFDEASQIKVPHSIGALGRARAAVIVGDSKQMPPTSVAQVGVIEEDPTEIAGDVEIVRDDESILTECTNARVPDLMLSWHYRSADESLIAFSNKEYYDGRLSTFPRPRGKGEARAVTFTYVEGGVFAHRGASFGRDAGTNRKEAERIVADIVAHVNDPARAALSLGVVTFNRPQQDLIQTLLAASTDAALQTALNPDERAESVKVWNLETVQGHERDVVLFSVAFSKDERGQISRNWGPLTQSGGQRRLNVAVTRARQRVGVYCSFLPHELNVDGVAHDGLKHLHAYLRLALDGPEASGALSSREVTAPDRHRDEIVRALLARGLLASSDVGLSRFKVDIAISDADGAERVGILLDGPSWYERSTVGDRDALPMMLLHDRMGWPVVMRIWLPDWLRDPSGEVDRVVAALADAEVLVGGVAQTEQSRDPEAGLSTTSATEEWMSAGSSAPVVAQPAPSAAPLTRADLREQRPAPDPVSGAPLWRAWDVEIVGPEFVLDQLWDPATKQHVQRLAQHILSIEGPVKAARMAKLIGQAHGLQRVSAKRIADIDATIRPDFAVSEDDFFFDVDSGVQSYAAWSRTDAGAGRGIDEVSLREIGNAMRDIARVGLGASRDELVRSAAQLFGVGRVTGGIRERLDSALAVALRDGVVVESNGYIVAAD